MSATATDAARNATLRLKGTWSDARSSGTACCPAHGDRTASLSITVGRKAVLYHCFAGCTQAAVIAAIKALNIDTRVDASIATAPVPMRPGRDDSALARSIWANALPIRGTLAERYLAKRGITGLNIGRFEPRSVTYIGDQRVTLPALILPYDNGREITAIQRIFLDPADAGKSKRLAKAKRNLGLPADGAIRFGKIVDGVLNLAEGPEDAASAIIFNSLPGCWAVCGIERYARIAIPEEVHTIRLWTQHGAAAEAGLAKARDHLTANGRKLDVELPPPGGDWNDALMARFLAAETVTAFAAGQGATL